ncbi:Toll-like receptor 22 [Scophthalmus maximus]|uniref:Toll-like receptor 22 n=2 Tax=Scophthalmus maximus TaxID=52904 RepID=A0A2U9CYC9_SCOMX|nr:Toll-like receptor 22 [Scophthalmus maximus]
MSVTGFALKTCRVSYNIAICVKMKLIAVPQDIPSTVKGFDLSANIISRVQVTDFQNFKILTQLELNRNRISGIDNGAFANLISLEKLNLNNNKLVGLGEDLFHGLSNLTELRINDVFPNLTWFNIGGSPGKQQMIWDIVNSSLTSLRMNAMKRGLTALINISCTIPTMSRLQVRRNKLSYVSSDLFKLCFNVTEMDLAENKIKNIPDNAFRSLQSLRILSLSRNRLSSVPAATRKLPSLTELDLSFNNITKLGCDDFANQTKLRRLNLYGNSISALQECLFKDLIQLQVLKLQNNRISNLNSAFQNYLPNLRQLLLNGNELTEIIHGEFSGLKSLQNLSLLGNKIKTLEEGCFIGLTNLTDILLQNNHITEIEINKSCFNDLINLRRLDLRENHIKYENSSSLPHAPFSQLSRLESLAIPSQHGKGKSQLPRNFLQGLTNLLFFNSRNIQLLALHKDMFNDTPQLQKLDISSNELMDLSPDLFSPIQNLKSLYISRTSLRSLDYLTGSNLTKLEFLQARKNEYSVISEEIIKSVPGLVYADFQGNSFTCDCDNAWFIKWVKNNNETQVFDAYNFECNYPVNLKGMKLLELDIRSCSVDVEFIFFISSTCSILFFMVVSFTYHFLRWQLTYAYYLFLALLFDTKHKNKRAPNQYDAFISYNTHDEAWVIRELLPKLEGEQGWRLCLHHRDFEPGKPIIENITDAIYGSRKTICVISRRYLESEWCSREMQVASFRLFDEQKDVLILVFLEEIPTSELFPHYRMRKLLNKRTYLSWPRAGEHTELFWEKLRQALQTRDDRAEDCFLLTVLDVLITNWTKHWEIAIRYWLDVSCCFITEISKMGSEVKDDKTTRTGERQHFPLILFFCLLNISGLLVPVTGFALKTCRVSYNIAKCVKMKLIAVPRDIPSTVKRFDLSANIISRVQVTDFQNFKILTQLELNCNMISGIDNGAFANLISLKKLNLNNNKLVGLGEDLFHGLSNLTELRINGNLIQDVASSSFRDMKSLTFLDISHNKLHQITKVHSILQHLPHLRDVKIKNNGLTTFCSWELTNSSVELKHLDFGLQMAFDDMKTLLEIVNSSLTSLSMNAMKCGLTALINISCTIPTMSRLELRQNKLSNVSLDLFKLCFNVTEMDLTRNKIKNIHENAFRSLQSPRILSLSRNRLSSVPAATRKLPSLTELDLSFNIITELGCDDFANQTELRHLQLDGNLISALQKCLFKDLIRLQVLKLQNNRISNLNSAFKNYLPNLTKLFLNENELTEIKHEEFSGLKSLQNLSLVENKIKTLEEGCFIGLRNLMDILLQKNNLKEIEINKGLTNLLFFNSRNIQLLALHKDMFNDTPQLQKLDISSNELMDLSPDLFSPIQNLKSLYISRTSLQSLDFLVNANLTKLKFLQARKNEYSVISEEIIKSVPGLIYADFQGNSFTCDCDNAWFIKWVKNNNETQVFDAYNFECNYPVNLKGMKLLEINIRSCSVDVEFIFFISSTCSILFFMVVSFTYHFLRWQLTYAYYLFLALLFDTKHKNKRAPNQYDAFISYNTHDEAWVIRELLPKLEGEQGWRLCLHHRDFEPGKPIMENITDAIYGSRKCICVITRRYLESEWCSREMQVASFRLFDEHKDVLILVFLEEIPAFELSPHYRMRKLLRRRTYLSWPRAGEQTELFWEKLRQALQTRDDGAEDCFLLPVEDRP